ELKIAGEIGARKDTYIKVGIQKDKGKSPRFIQVKNKVDDTTTVIQAPYVNGNIDLTGEMGFSLESDIFLSGIRVINLGAHLIERYQQKFETQNGLISRELDDFGSEWKWNIPDSTQFCTSGSFGAGLLFTANMQLGAKVDTWLGEIEGNININYQYPNQEDIDNANEGWIGTWYKFLQFEKCWHDSLIPTVTLNGEETVTLNFGEEYKEEFATAYDEQDGDLTSLITIQGDVDIFKVGTYTLIYSVTDSTGMSNSKIRTVIVQDKTPPVITLNGEGVITLYTGDTYVEEYAVAVDNVDGVLIPYIDGSVDTAKAGSYIITYTAQDSSGNIAKPEKRYVIVKESNNTIETPAIDTTPPVITLIGNKYITLRVGDSYQEQGVNAIDEVDGVIFVDDPIEYVDTSKEGKYTLTYYAKDKSGNEAVEYRYITVEGSATDTTPPTITLNGEASITLHVGDIYEEQGATALDNIDGAITPTIGGDSVDTSKSGTYRVIYTAVDQAKNEATKVREVTVLAKDTTAPIIVLNGESIINLDIGDTYQEYGAIATDDFDGNISVSISGEVNSSQEGNYTITYKAIDSSGNAATQTREVRIMEANTPPIAYKQNITLIGNSSITIKLNATDEDNDTLTYTIETEPQNGVLSGTLPNIIYTPNSDDIGSDSFTFSVNDSKEDSNSATINIFVNKPSNSSPIKQTEQIKSYDSNGSVVTDESIKDDGYYQSGVEPTYTRDAINEIVIDHVTGLMWQDNKEVETITKPIVTEESVAAGNYFDTSGDTANTYCTNLNLGGYNDWRLPSIIELLSIVVDDRFNPTIDTTVFHHYTSNRYSSSTDFQGNERINYVLNFEYGNIGSDTHKATPYYIRCVRTSK
ncbi:MAG: DUF5011 domain-containing protein, partial [Campylobacterales bacterium]|nr:DUF5011 domain-containing protein [Campylobacterales bacterium]